MFSFSLGSVSSHVAALLFKLEACVIIQQNKKAITSQLCAWNRSRKRAEPAMQQNINFKRPKKEQIVPAEINNKVHPETHFSLSASSFAKSAVLQTKLQELKDIVPNAAIFSSFPIQKGICDFSIDFEYETLTADKCDNNLLPERLTSLFDYEAVNLEKRFLKEHSLKLFTQNRGTYNQQCFYRSTELTKIQSLSKNLNVHRAGRITASNSYSAIHTRNSISLFNNQTYQTLNILGE